MGLFRFIQEAWRETLGRQGRGGSTEQPCRHGRTQRQGGQDHRDLHRIASQNLGVSSVQVAFDPQTGS